MTGSTVIALRHTRGGSGVTRAAEGSAAVEDVELHNLAACGVQVVPLADVPPHATTTSTLLRTTAHSVVIMMRRAFAIGTAAVGGLAALRRPADMHCQVPCGIYNEQLRLDAMAEDAQTVRHRFSSASVRCCRPRARSSQRVCRSVPARCAQIRKAMVQINDLAGSSDAKAANQLVRWISTKEEHASKIQKTVAEVRT